MSEMSHTIRCRHGRRAKISQDHTIDLHQEGCGMARGTMIGFVVDRVITCDAVSGMVIGGCEHTVVVDKSSGFIISVSEGIPEDESIELIRFPPGSTLLPGFIDCHVHLTIATDDYQMDHLRQSSADKTLRALRAAQGLLRAGFTTIRSAGDADKYYPTFAVARSINRGDFEGPRIVGAGHYISVTGGGADLNFLAEENCHCCCADGIIADGIDQMVLAVRREIKNGSDWIKVLATGAFMSASTGPKDSPENTHFSPQELQAVVQEAARRQVSVMAHAHGADGIVLAAKAGCRSIEHASFIDEVGIQACLERDTWIVPTFSVGEHFLEKGSPTKALDRTLALLESTNARYYECIRRAVAAGVKVALGSDFVGWDPAITAREFRYLVELAGMSPMAAILSGTTSAAALLGYAESLGRITPGYIADMVVVSGNPIEDISVLEKNVLCVVKGGHIVSRE